MNDYSPFITGNPAWNRERRGWYRSFQAELFAQLVYTRILSDASVLEHFRSDDSIQAFWEMDKISRRAVWGKGPANLNELADYRFITRRQLVW